MAKDKVKERVNWPVTILLIIGLITIIFPLYMAVVIAFKDPSEMTNDIAGILSLPSTWSLDNFIEAIQVTDFFHSFMNSLIITVVAVVVSVLVHSLAAYAIGRNMDHKRIFKLVVLLHHRWYVRAVRDPYDAAREADCRHASRQHGGRHDSLRGVLHAHEHDALHRLPAQRAHRA